MARRHVCISGQTMIKKRCNRKQRFDKEFVWTKEDIHKLHTLNEGLAQMQVRFAEKMREVYEIFPGLKQRDVLPAQL